MMQMWPRPGDLSEHYYDTWLKMAIAWVLVTETCQFESWYMDLESISTRFAVGSDGVMDMVAFFEVFYHGLAYCDFEVYCIVRDCMGLF
jgi:hypothetical protein